MIATHLFQVLGFHQPTLRMFDLDTRHSWSNGADELVIDVEDPGSITFAFLAKEPGPEMRLARAEMEFRYESSFAWADNLEPYERLILDAMSIAPGFSCICGLVGAIAPSGSSVEAFSWIGSGIQAGAAAGAALGGVAVEALGTRSSFVLAACGAIATAIIARQRSDRRGRVG